MRIFRHQPLTIWTLLVVLLLGLGLFGLFGGQRETITVVNPAQTSGGPQARELLVRAQGAFGALGSNELDVWAKELERDLGSYAKQFDTAPQAEEWTRAHLAAVELAQNVDAPRETVLARISAVQRALISLARSYP